MADSKGKKYVLRTARPTASGLDLANELNPQQRAVVEAPPGKLLVLAGAGSGKTRTLTYRVARLVNGGCKPERMMLVTFTNKAAREMVDRVEGLLGIDMRDSAAGTFHHVGNRILRRHGESIGLSPGYGILDSEDARDLMTTVVGELGLPTLTAKRFPSAKVLCSAVSMASGTMHSVERILDLRHPRFVDQTPLILRVAKRYHERKRELDVVDFDDLLSLWLRLLRNPDAGRAKDELLDAFDHLLVDEYQDINALQGALIDAMAERHESLTCVGDDAQSIYSFRGADFSQIHDFKIRHPSAQVFSLTINYRSVPEVLELANRSIALNEDQHPKQLVPVRKPGMTPAVVPLRDVYQQAELVAQRVLELHHEQDLPLRKMAVLYRNHSHGLELQVELTQRQIPFSVRSGMRFFEQAHIKDVVAYLRARDNPKDTLAWVRLLRLWPGIGTRISDQVAGQLAEVPKSEVGEALGRIAGVHGGRAEAAFGRLSALWRMLDGSERGEDPSAAIRAVVDEHYAEYADTNFPNADARKEDLEHLAAFAGRYVDSRDFLSQLALIQGVSAEHLVSGEEPDDKLILSTIHQAKGLEWPIVFVIGLCEGKFPTAQSLRSRKDLEEERRLFYVAATRAADELYCCYPTIEDGRDGPRKLLRASRFLSEIDHTPAVFDRWQIEEAPLDDEPDDPRT